jgi:hypothetical protein
MDDGLSGPVIGLIWVFGWAAFYLLLRAVNTTRWRAKLELIHKERLMAIEKGHPLPELPEYEERPRISIVPRLSPRWPLGLGALSITTGIGATIAMWLSNLPEHHDVWPMGLVGVFGGIGLFFYYALTRPRPAGIDG